MASPGIESTDSTGRRGLTPRAKAVVGGVLAAISLLLLLLPLPGAGAAVLSAAWLVRIRLATLGDETTQALGLPLDIGYLVWRWFFVALVLAVVLLLVVLPWWRAARTQRWGPTAPGIGQDGSADTPAEEIRRLRDGRLVGDDSSLTGEIVRTPRQLSHHAEAHRMRWHEDYESPGGARVLLDLLWALEERDEQSAPGTGAEARRDEASRRALAPQEPVRGGGEEGEPRGSAPEVTRTVADPVGVEPGPADPEAADPAPVDPAGTDPVGVAPVGSVYSSTQLYSSAPSALGDGGQRIGLEDEGRIGLEDEARIGEADAHDEGGAR
ncbi:hypothetical protein ACT3SP_06570 [Brachybacterium sp. AOP43-C2-M15]|uniref:hypothetical protein n=1 Tax=Brachybacterium sp. AOP43-C2-M15 TaxID=3457661 RepID=UPI004033B56E